MRILIAAHSQSQRHWLEETLANWGHDIVAVSDGKEAWQLLSSETAPRLVILDRVMPGLDGLEICRRFRESCPSRSAYFILLTAKAEGRVDSAEGPQGKPDDYLLTPVDADELRARVSGGIRVLELQASLAARTKELEQEARQRQEAERSLQRCSLELATMNTVAKTLSTTLELDRLLERALDALQQVIPYDAALISLLPDANLPGGGRPDATSPTAWIAATRGLEHMPLAERGLILDEFPLIQRVVQARSPVVVPDVRDEPEWLPIDELGPVRSWLGVPLIYRDRVSGVLMVDSHQPNTYDEETARLASVFAQQAVLAIENSRLYGQTRAQLREALLLHSVTAAFSSTLDVDQMLPYVTRSLCEILHATSARIYDLGEETHAATLVAHYASSEATEEERLSGVGQTYALADLPAAAETLTRSRPMQIRVDDLAVDPRERAVLENQGIKSTLLLPMVTHGRPVGLAVVWETQGARHFTQGEIATGQTLTHQATIAMEHARLFTETQKSARQLEALYETSRALSSSLEEESLMRTILEAVYRALNCKYVLIAIVDENARSIGVRHGIWDGEFDALPEWIRMARYSLDHPDILADIYRTGQTEIIEEWDARFSREVWEKFGHEQFARIFMPIRMRDHIIGVVEVGYDKHELSTRGGLVGDDEIQMLTAFMDQAAIALENARLFEQAGRRAQELQFLHDVSLAAATETHLQETLQGAAQALAAEMNGTRVALLLLESESSVLRLVAGVGYPRDLIGSLRLGLEEGISGWVAKHGKPLIIPDVHLDPHYYEVSPDIRSELCVPLTAGPFIIGALNVASPQVNAFTQDDLRLLSTLASNIALLVERARLFTEVEQARTELQQRANALEEANNRLQELDRLKDQFLATMSHELRTPLNSVIGFSEVLMKGHMGELSPGQRECVHNILISGEHLLALINNILDLSKIEAGRMTLDVSAFDVAELLAEVEATIAPLIEKKSQVLRMELADDLPPLVADRFRIKQVLINLFGNANKFTPAGGRITVSCRLADANTMLFFVADTGIGIRPEEQDIIFEEFRQASSPSGAKVKGTGLGLAISQRLVELHGSRIWVESEYEHGATFSFLLPIAGPPEAAPEQSDETTLPSDGKKVLVVEDDQQFSNLLALYLRQEGYVPVQHYSGQGVEERAREVQPALITLDIMLPDQSGWDVLRSLKSSPATRHTPVLVISVLEDRKLAVSLGATDYLVKPIYLEDLRVLLNRLAAGEGETQQVKVLAVDDDPEMSLLLEAMIPDEGYTLLSAYDGDEGLSLAHSEHPDVILLDLMLPGLSGFEVLERLRADAETADTPVIVLTAKSVSAEERQLLTDHIQGLMNKTALTPQSLMAELRRLEAPRP